MPAKELYINKDEGLVPVGKIVFETKKLSLNGNISCQTCHLSQFGSADGIPNAAAIGGTGEDHNGYSVEQNCYRVTLWRFGEEGQRV